MYVQFEKQKLKSELNFIKQYDPFDEKILIPNLTNSNFTVSDDESYHSTLRGNKIQGKYGVSNRKKATIRTVRFDTLDLGKIGRRLHSKTQQRIQNNTNHVASFTGLPIRRFQ